MRDNIQRQEHEFMLREAAKGYANPSDNAKRNRMLTNYQKELRARAEGSKDVGMAMGGIVTSPTRVLLGERGREAVVPLAQAPALVMPVEGSKIADDTLARAVARANTKYGKGAEINMKPLEQKLDAILSVMRTWMSDNESLPPGFADVMVRQ